MPDPELPSEVLAIRARMLALSAAHAGGEIDDETYETARREAERALSDAVLATPPDAGASPSQARVGPSWKLMTALVAVVLVIAIGGYAFTGSPSLAGIGKPPPAASDVASDGASGDREIGLQQIAAMVDTLATRLKDRPDDREGWTMLARSYTVLRRYPEAVPAYRHAIDLQPKDAALLADFADVLAAANDGRPSAESLALLDRSLAIDPEQPKALALAGTAAFDRGDFAAAAAQWQKIADALPPGSEFHRQVMANIYAARRRGGLPPATPSASGKPPAAVATAAAGREALTGTVTLDPALASRASPADTVFVLARPESGRMPLAVFRATVKDLPLTFRLDDSMAMTPTMKLSDMKKVIVAARVSKSGNAITQPGDLSGESGPVAPGTGGLAIVIGSVAAGR